MTFEVLVIIQVIGIIYVIYLNIKEIMEARKKRSQFDKKKFENIHKKIQLTRFQAFYYGEEYEDIWDEAYCRIDKQPYDFYNRIEKILFLNLFKFSTKSNSFKNKLLIELVEEFLLVKNIIQEDVYTYLEYSSYHPNLHLTFYTESFFQSKNYFLISLFVNQNLDIKKIYVKDSIIKKKFFSYKSNIFKIFDPYLKKNYEILLWNLLIFIIYQYILDCDFDYSPVLNIIYKLNNYFMVYENIFNKTVAFFIFLIAYIYQLYFSIFTVYKYNYFFNSNIGARCIYLLTKLRLKERAIFIILIKKFKFRKK